MYDPRGARSSAALLPSGKPQARKCVLYGLPCFATHTFDPASVCQDAVTVTRGFMNPKVTVLHALQEAWVLAGMETTPPPVTDAILSRMPASCRVALALCVQQRVAHVTRYATWVGINFPVLAPCDGQPTATLDYVFMDRDACLHACVINTEGTPVDSSREDVLRVLVLAAGLQDSRLASVRVLYPLRGESVVVHTTAWSPASLRGVLTRGMRAWVADDFVVYAICCSESATLQRFSSNGTEQYTPDGSAVTVYTIDDFWEVVGSQRRVVAFAYVQFAGSDQRYDDFVQDGDGRLFTQTNPPTSLYQLRDAYVTAQPCLHTVHYVKQIKALA